MSLQRDLGLKHPIEPLLREAIVSILYTRELYQIQHSRLFHQHHFTTSQFIILYILQDEGIPMTIREISHRIIVAVPGITGLIDRLEKNGFVARERCTKDRRTIYVVLTDKGRAALSAIAQPLHELREKFTGHMSEAELKELIRLLEKSRELLLAEQKDDDE